MIRSASIISRKAQNIWCFSRGPFRLLRIKHWAVDLSTEDPEPIFSFSSFGVLLFCTTWKSSHRDQNLLRWVRKEMRMRLFPRSTDQLCLCSFLSEQPSSKETAKKPKGMYVRILTTHRCNWWGCHLLKRFASRIFLVQTRRKIITPSP